MARLTAGGVVLFVVGLLFFLSRGKESRIGLAGFQVHPTVLAGFLAAPFAGARLRRFPKQLGQAFAVFAAGMWVVTVFDERLMVSPAVKLMTTLAFTVAVFSMVRSPQDYLAATLGFGVGVAAIGVVGVFTGDVGTETFNPLASIGNKNAFSLFGLPCILICAELAMRRGVSVSIRAVLLACAATVALVIFLSANRSGWLSAVLIGLLLVANRGGRLRGAILVSVVVGTVLFTLNEFFDTGVFERRVNQTLEGYASDTFRIALFKNSFWVGLEHPLVGAGPATFGYELASRVREFEDLEQISPHNAITSTFGVGGLVLVIGWVMVGRALWRHDGAPTGATPMIRLTLILWLVRGLFTDEVLYAPAFAFVFGLSIAAETLRREDLARATASQAVPPAPAASAISAAPWSSPT